MLTTNGFIATDLEEYVRYSEWIEWHGEQDQAVTLDESGEFQGLWSTGNHVVILRSDGSYEIIRHRHSDELVRRYRLLTAQHLMQEDQDLTGEEVEYLTDIIESEGR